MATRKPAGQINSSGINDIMLTASSLQYGEVSEALLCPFCLGGQSGEKKLYVGREGSKVWWTCFRASCGAKGKRELGGAAPAYRTAVNTSPKSKSLSYTMCDDTDDVARLRAAKIKSQLLMDVTPYTDAYGGRFVFPVYARDGVRRGAVLRTYSPNEPTKVLSDLRGYTGCAWFSDTALSSAIIVTEDIPSAALAHEATGITAAALLGTDLNESKYTDIMAARPTTVILCLDEDALPVAVRTAVKLTKLGTNVVWKVVPLTKDIKDMNQQELTEFNETIKAVL